MAATVTVRFGKKLRQLRERAGDTQLSLAMRLGVDRSYLSDLERGKKSPTLTMLEVLALGFHLKVSELLEDID